MSEGQEVIKSISIKLDVSAGQEQELNQLFESFRLGINWSLKEIEKRYQVFLKTYRELPDDQKYEGVCPLCSKKARISHTEIEAGRKICSNCARTGYSEYTVRKEIYGTGKREAVGTDLKDITLIPNKTHYDTMFSQAYAMWKSYRGWVDKRLREKALVEAEINSFSPELKHAVEEIEQNARHIKERNNKLTWKLAKAQAFKNVYSIHPGIDEKEISRAHDKYMDLMRLSRPIHFPELKECRTVKMKDHFVQWKDRKLYLTLFHKGSQEMGFFGNKPKFLFSWVPWTKIIAHDNDIDIIKFLGRKHPWLAPLPGLFRNTPGVKCTISDDCTSDPRIYKLNIFHENNFISLSLNDDMTRLYLDSGIFEDLPERQVKASTRTELIVKSENGMLNVYKPAYLTRFIPEMEADNKAYCNLTRKGNDYYLMYPLTIKVRQPPDIKECDTFVYISSPTKAAIIGYDPDGAMQSVKWFPTGQLAFAKRHFKEKRAEIAARQDLKDARRMGLAGDERTNHKEKMRKIRRRKKKIIRRGGIEARYVSTFNHKLTREMVDYVMDQSENPKLVIWDVGNGITQNFGRLLNYRKNLWAAVQQQEYLKHKAMQASIPIIEVKYNKCNDLVCSSCGMKQVNGSETVKKKNPMKVITQLIKGIKNFKCQKCGYEINTLINQANNVLQVSVAKAGVSMPERSNEEGMML